jgi:glycosyltransferase involved in cell wall biosynthesis
MPFSVIIITYNEERNIVRCLESLADVADDILVVDSFSTDKTREICQQNSARFIKREFDGYGNQKRFATEHAKFDYILSLDADEALSLELKSSILSEKDKW